MRINVPSWCDRILWKSHPETHLVCNSYGERDGDRAGAEPGAARAVPKCPCPSPGCTDDIVTSDHSPVFATFEVGVTSQFVPKSGEDEGTGSVPTGTWGPTPHPLSPPAPPAAPGSSPEPLACIEWESIEVIVKTASRSKCYIEFHSYCLEGEVAPQGGVPGVGTPARGWSCAPLSPALSPQRLSGAGRTTPRAATCPASSGWAGRPSSCPWYAPHPAGPSSILLPPRPHPSHLTMPWDEPRGAQGAVTVPEDRAQPCALPHSSSPLSPCS